MNNMDEPEKIVQNKKSKKSKKKKDTEENKTEVEVEKKENFEEGEDHIHNRPEDDQNKFYEKHQNEEKNLENHYEEKPIEKKIENHYEEKPIEKKIENHYEEKPIEKKIENRYEEKPIERGEEPILNQVNTAEETPIFSNEKPVVGYEKLIPLEKPREVEEVEEIKSNERNEFPTYAQQFTNTTIGEEVPVKTIRVHYNPGFGKCLIITGDDESIGSWNTGFKMEYLDDTKEWVFRSKRLRNGTQFKVIIHDWFEEETLDVDQLRISNPKSLRWENQQGAAGNKTMNFVNNELTHTPQF